MGRGQPARPLLAAEAGQAWASAPQPHAQAARELAPTAASPGMTQVPARLSAAGWPAG
jgi:hypothetical protein